MLTQDELETEVRDLGSKIVKILDEEGLGRHLQPKTVLKIQKLILEVLRKITSSSVLDDDS